MLIPFSAEHFWWLAKWITDKEILFQSSGTYFRFPLSLQQLENYQEKHPDRRFYMSYLDDTPYAFGELIPKADQPPRLARLLIGDPNLRGKGLGELFVRELIEEARRLYAPEELDLFVLEWNTSAIRCYQKVGFHFTSDPPFSLEFEGHQHQVRRMRLDLKSETAPP